MTSKLPRQWIFLRGLSRESTHWGDFPQRCQEAFGWQIECLDLPGFGDQHRRLSPITLNAVLEDVRSRASEPSNTDKIGILGLSLGGMLALQWAASYPQDLGAVIIINSSSTNNPLHHRLKPTALLPLIKSLGSRSIKRQERAVLKMVSNQFTDDEDVLAKWVQIRQRAKLQKRNVIRQLIAASHYRSPTANALKNLEHGLVLSSRTDRMVSWKCSEFFAARYHWPLALHHSAGHDLPLDDPAWILAEIAHWQGS